MSLELSTKVVELSEALKKHLTYEGEEVAVSKDAFEATLPEGITAKTFSDVEDHKKNLASALLTCTQQLSENDMKANKVQKVSAAMVLGRSGKIEVELNRSETRPTSVTDRTPITVYGSSRVKIRGTASNKSGELKKAQQIISERAKSLWGK